MKIKGITVIIIFSAFSIFIMGIGLQKSNATPSNPYSGTGDWTITNGETITDQSFIISGDIIITSSSTLEFRNNTITMFGALRIQSGNHIFYNNSISSSTSNGLKIESGTNNTFIDNYINADTTYGAIISSNSNKFINNTFKGSGHALDLFGSSNFFENNLMTAQGRGIVHYSGSTNNNFTNNVIDSTSSAMLMEGSNTFFFNNTVNSTGYGVSISGVQNNLTGNTYNVADLPFPQIHSHNHLTC